MSKVSMARREFVVACAMVPFAHACARMAYLSAEVVEGGVRVSRTDVDANGYALVEVPGLAFPVYVHHVGGDDYSAVLTRCTHRGCTVEPQAGHLVCPCHGSEFTPTGLVMKGPAEQPLRKIPVRVEGDRLVLMVTAVTTEGTEDLRV